MFTSIKYVACFLVSFLVRLRTYQHPGYIRLQGIGCVPDQNIEHIATCVFLLRLHRQHIQTGLRHVGVSGKVHPNKR